MRKVGSYVRCQICISLLLWNLLTISLSIIIAHSFALFATFKARFPSIDLFSSLFLSISTALKRAGKTVPSQKKKIKINMNTVESFYFHCGLHFSFLQLIYKTSVGSLVVELENCSWQSSAKCSTEMWGYNLHQSLCLQVFSFIWLIKIRLLKLSGFSERGKDFSCFFPFIKCLQCHSPLKLWTSSGKFITPAWF